MYNLRTNYLVLNDVTKSSFKLPSFLYFDLNIKATLKNYYCPATSTLT